MKKFTKAEQARREAVRRTSIRRETIARADTAERHMLSRIRLWSLLTMLVMPLLVDGVLRAVNVWVDTYLAVYYPSTAVTALQWVVYYAVILLRIVYQFSGFAVLGYSVMRYSVKKSLFPVWMALLATTLTNLAGIGETIYTSGINAVRSELSYILPFWILNYALALFTTLCVIFLCAMLRLAFLRHGRMQVSITEESPEARKANVLRRLYRWIAGLLFVFNFIPGIMNMVMELSEAGAPGDIWDVISLLQPIAEIILFALLGYYCMLSIGRALTQQNRTELERANQAPLAQQQPTQL